MIKKLSLTLLMAIVASVFAFAGNDKAQITFEQKTHDFGNIAEAGGSVSCEFEFVNTGDAPLVIISATASCGCTRPEYPVEPIKPGKKGKVKVTYNPLHRPGEFDKTVKLRTNAANAKKVNLRITGVVIPAKSDK